MRTSRAAGSSSSTSSWTPTCSSRQTFCERDRRRRRILRVACCWRTAECTCHEQGEHERVPSVSVSRCTLVSHACMLRFRAPPRAKARAQPPPCLSLCQARLRPSFGDQSCQTGSGERHQARDGCCIAFFLFRLVICLAPHAGTWGCCQRSFGRILVCGSTFVKVAWKMKRP
jgi:hypothetical protein